MSDFPISQADWLTQKTTIETRIEELRTQLEQPDSPIDFLRGQIDSLRWIIAIAEPGMAEVVPLVSYT